MASAPGDKNLLLGKAVAVSERYAPELLYPIPRSEARDRLGLGAAALPFSGEDIWHAYEMSWLDGRGRPEAFVGRFRIPADSPNLVESKSFKLYLNSLNHESFASQEEAAARICADIAKVAGAAVKLELLAVDDPALAGKALPGDSLDHLDVPWGPGEPDVSMLRLTGDDAEMQLHTHLLRSLCPVTGPAGLGQPVAALRGQGARPRLPAALPAGLPQPPGIPRTVRRAHLPRPVRGL